MSSEGLSLNTPLHLHLKSHLRNESWTISPKYLIFAVSTIQTNATELVGRGDKWIDFCGAPH